MSVLLVRETVRSKATLRKKKTGVGDGTSRDLVDRVRALQNVEAEFGYAQGSSLADYGGDDLPCIVDARFTRDEQVEILEATRVMWEFFAGPRIGCRMSAPFAGPMKRIWDLDRLETVFMKAGSTMSPAVRKAIAVMNDSEEIIERRIVATDTATRAECLATSLTLLAGECTLLRIRLRHRPTAVADA